MDKDYKLFHGDSQEVLKTMEENSISAVVTDPPYGINFMNKKWDYRVPTVEHWKEVYRVLKPGGIALIFAGSRTAHRMTVNVEDAGFEIRDTIMWVYGSGFPKSHNISKAIDKQAGVEREVIGVHHRHGGGKEKSGSMAGKLGTNSELPLTAPATPEAERWNGYGTALKPSYEPIIVAMKPTEGTFANNAITHGVAGMNIDDCRVPYSEGNPPIPQLAQGKTEVNSKRTMFDGQSMNKSSTKATIGGDLGGRFPANLIHDGSDEVVDAFPDAKGQQGDLRNHNKNRKSPNGCFGEMGPAKDYIKKEETNKSASRFFYCAKANKKDRGDGNQHPTVKPISLMRYLCRLVKMPENSIILDPFMGSGRTGIASLLEGNKFIGIEREEESFKICEEHIENYEDFNFEK